MTEKEFLSLLGDVYEEYQQCAHRRSSSPKGRQDFLKACQKEEARQIRQEVKKKLPLLVGISGVTLGLIATLLILCL